MDKKLIIHKYMCLSIYSKRYLMYKVKCNVILCHHLEMEKIHLEYPILAMTLPNKQQNI